MAYFVVSDPAHETWVLLARDGLHLSIVTCNQGVMDQVLGAEHYIWRNGPGPAPCGSSAVLPGIAIAALMMPCPSCLGGKRRSMPSPGHPTATLLTAEPSLSAQRRGADRR